MYVCDRVVCVILAGCFFFNDTATTEIYTYGPTLARHDALPSWGRHQPAAARGARVDRTRPRRPARRHRDRDEGADLRQSPRPGDLARTARPRRTEEHTSELQSLMRSSYAVFCLHKKIIDHVFLAIDYRPMR